jgi:hypothetical protein
MRNQFLLFQKLDKLNGSYIIVLEGTFGDNFYKTKNGIHYFKKCEEKKAFSILFALFYK